MLPKSRCFQVLTRVLAYMCLHVLPVVRTFVVLLESGQSFVFETCHSSLHCKSCDKNHI